VPSHQAANFTSLQPSQQLLMSDDEVDDDVIDGRMSDF
jgi:hypothetical protein